MTDERRQWSEDGKEVLRILKRHWVDRVDISKICEEENIHASQFYKWQAMFFSDGAAVFQRKPKNTGHQELKEAKDKIASLETKLQKKNAVLAELMEEHVLLKKELGEA
jgi:transposase-like protein